MDINLYHLSDAERKEAGIECLPGSLGEAISIAENSDLVKNALGEHIFPRFIHLKKQEWEEYRIQVTEYELNRYLPIL
jgi:glutamine synthetase